jgi:hypothetical protein
MERIEIPGHATKTPLALTDLLVAAPLASRLLLGATLPGSVVSAAALGLYAGSAARDWTARMGIRPVDFRREYDGDVDSFEKMPIEERQAEIVALGRALNEAYTPERRPREKLAEQVNQRLTDYIASMTGQEVVTSSSVRNFTLAKLIFPFALGTCDVVSGDVAIFRDTGIFEAHVIAHEFCHRKGYWKELHAQVLAYLALRTSTDPLLVQSARAERLHRHLRVLAGDDTARFEQLLATASLRTELHSAFVALRPVPGAYEAAVGSVMKKVYEQRMKLSGQNGLADYDENFTNVLWTFSRSPRARQPREHASI